jgi:hypothetical protein
MQQSLDSSAMAGQNMIFPFACGECGLNAYKPDSTKKQAGFDLSIGLSKYNCTATAVNGAQV